MKTLYILRHAKSSWDNSDLSDFERPLNERGYGDAPLMGEILKERGFQPALILSSPAKRAEQTAALVRQSAEISGETSFDERIYEASPARLLEVIGEQNNQFDSILLVGHNPGLEGLINFLIGELHPMPTAALAVIDLEIENWSEINSVKGVLRTLIRPKEMKNEK